MTPTRRAPAGRVLGAVVTLTVLMLAACGGGDNGNPTAQEEEERKPKPPPVCPLTGEPPPEGIRLSRPAVAVKIENSPQARPQSGLEHADVVFEEIVEGGITRFAAIFHCDGAKQAGPVRSARFDDPAFIKPFSRALAYAGANATVEKELKEHNMVLFTELSHPGVLYRVPPGNTDVHSLFVNTEKIRKLAVEKNVRPPADDIFEFGPLPDKLKKARKIELHFSPSITIEYKWNGFGWARFEDGSPFNVVSGAQISVPNLLVQQTEVKWSNKIVDVAGNASPRIDLRSGGKALLFRDGRVIKGTWEAGKKGEAPTFETRKGDPFVFAPGAVWVELLPSKNGEVKGSISFR